MDAADNGISRDSVPTSGKLITIILFCGVALWNVIELSFIIFATFKCRSCTYFWSFLVASWGITPYAVGFLFNFFTLPPHAFSSPLSSSAVKSQ
ncbi:hypothetical protein OQA88_13346 [Cercophora sp. LCS_1]